MIGRLRARQAAWLAELDRRQVATADGCRSLEEWTAGRLDVERRTARRLVDASRRLGERPDVASALADGVVTFDRASVVCRAGTPLDEVAHLDIGQVSRRAAATWFTRHDERTAFERRHLMIQPTLDGRSGSCGAAWLALTERPWRID